MQMSKTGASRIRVITRNNFLERLEEGHAVSFLNEDELMIALPFLLDGLPLQ